MSAANPVVLMLYSRVLRSKACQQLVPAVCILSVLAADMLCCCVDVVLSCVDSCHGNTQTCRMSYILKRLFCFVAHELT